MPGHPVSAGVAGGPIELVAGEPDANGIAQVSIAEDVVVGAGLIVGQGAVCVKIFAADSSGQIDCDGGSPNDVTVSLDSHGADPGGSVIIESGQGSDGGPGALTMVAMQSTVLELAGFDFNNCASATFGEPTIIAYTTGTGTAEVLNPEQGGGTITLSQTGVNMDCSHWADGSGAKLVSPLPTEEPATDGVHIFVIGEPR